MAWTAIRLLRFARSSILNRDDVIAALFVRISSAGPSSRSHVQPFEQHLTMKGK